MSEAKPQPASHPAYWAERAIILVAILTACYGMWGATTRDSANSRLATAWSLVHQGDWTIDTVAGETPNRFGAATVDKVEVNGRIISSKPPILPLLMTAEYYGMHRLLGWNLDDEDDRSLIVLFMGLTLMATSWAICLVFFALLLDLFIAAPWKRVPILFALAFATQLPGFAPQLNNHTPGAAALMVSLYFALGIASGKLAATPARFFAYGFAGALVFALDMPATIFVALAGLPLLYRHPGIAIPWAGVGLALPLIIHFGVNYEVTDSFKPVQMRKDLYLFENSYWRNPGGLDALNEPKGTYLFHLSFGRFGSFMLFPVLLLGLLSAGFAMFRKNWPWRHYVLGGLVAFAVLNAYYVLRTNNYGGHAYGFRWHIASMPVLLLMAAPLVARMRGVLPWVVVVLLLIPSAYSAWECYQQPWGAQQEWTVRWLFGPAFVE